MALIKQDLNSDDRYVKMKAKYDGRCAECTDHIQADDPIVWDTKESKAYCECCGDEL
jgi:hypothetical protein